MRGIVLGILNYEDIGSYVKHDLRWVLNNRKLLNEERFPPEVLGYLVEVIVTRGYWRVWPKNQLIRRLKLREGSGIRVGNGEHIIIELREFNQLLKVIDELSRERNSNYWMKALSSVQALMKGFHKAGSLKRWVDVLYSLATADRDEPWKKHEYFKGIRGLGRKSVDIILRDMGYFDRVPVDIHERRFLLRTDIAVVYGPLDKDPTLPAFYSEALTTYCKENLKDISLEGISLESAPGVVDWAIWYFSCSSKEETKEKSLKCKAICSSSARCGKCPIRDLCLYRKRKEVLSILAMNSRGLSPR